MEYGFDASSRRFTQVKPELPVRWSLPLDHGRSTMCEALALLHPQVFCVTALIGPQAMGGAPIS